MNTYHPTPIPYHPNTPSPTTLVIPVGERGHCRTDAGAELHGTAEIDQGTLQHRKLRGEDGWMRLRRSHVPEPEELALQLAIARRDRHAVAMAHPAPQLLVADA